MQLCYRCYVSGKVQGVFFRASTRQQARKLGVTGYARNLPDDRVEVLMCGDESALNRLKKYLWAGPGSAVVEDIDCEQLLFQEIADFDGR